MAQEIHVSDVGTILRITIQDGGVAVDVSSATTQEIFLRKPSGTKLKKTSSFQTDGTDGIIQYTTISGDIDEGGIWRIQGHVIISAGEFFTDIGEFEVEKNL